MLSGIIIALCTIELLFIQLRAQRGHSSPQYSGTELDPKPRAVVDVAGNNFL